MPFQVSPGVNFSEIDLTTIVPALSTSIGALAGVFRWGPIGQRVLVDSEIALANKFGKPTNFNAETWFTGANFLSYSNALVITRAANTTGTNSSISAFNSIANVGSANAVLVKNEDHYTGLDGTFDSDILYIAKYAGSLGDSLRVSVCDAADQFAQDILLYTSANNPTLSSDTKLSIAVGSKIGTVMFRSTSNADIADATSRATTVRNEFAKGDLVLVGNTTIGQQYMKIKTVGALATPVSNSTGGWQSFTLTFEENLKLHTAYESNTISRQWEFRNLVESAPGQSDYVAQYGNSSAQDELHVVVVDEDGMFSGIPGTVLEVYKNLSRATDAKTLDGGTNYYKTVINEVSNYVWWANDRTGAASNTALLVSSASETKPLNVNFVNGSDGANETDVSLGVLLDAYSAFAIPEEVDISFVLAGKTLGSTHINFLIDNIAEVRKDCMVFASPQKGDVVNNDFPVDAVVEFRNTLRSTSYAVLDSGYKYMYDRYNDVYRWVPLNGDIAGLCARTDNTNDPWWSPAGYNRGQIKNIVRLAYNPKLAERDSLYKAGVNPVVTFPGQGTVLYGDKTLLAKPSAFDRINVRRLFIILEKSISTAAKYTLFEFNDSFTRSQFKNMINPYLRDVQGRRGITDFLVVCDESNNTGEVIDSNRFIGDIYIKPARSINFIQLNFVAVRTGVQFSEVVGRF